MSGKIMKGKKETKKQEVKKGKKSVNKVSDVEVSSFKIADNLLNLSTIDGEAIENSDKLIDVLQSDCVRAFTAKGLGEGEDNYSSGSTFFIAADATPKSGLESLALQIFSKHTKGKSFDPSRSGAEWWTQVIDPEDDIGFHWDRDYELEEEEGVHMYPVFGTVSYLSDIGAPTIVMDAVGTDSAEDDIQGEFSKVSLCYPKSLRHLRFDGRLLHAAPSGLLQEDEDEEEEEEDGNEDDEEETNAVDMVKTIDDVDSTAETEDSKSGDEDDDEEFEDEESISSSKAAEQRATAVAELLPKKKSMRVTFLVNIWLNHVPSQGTCVPSDIEASFQCPTLAETSMSLLPASEANVSSKTMEILDTDRVKMNSFVHAEFVYDVAVPLPSDIAVLEAAATAQEVVHLQYFGEMKPMVMLNELQALAAQMNGGSDDEDMEDDEESEEEEIEQAPKKKQRRA